MATILHRKKGDQFFDANGDPLDGGKLWYYQAGTSTPQNTFFDADGLIGNVNTNPVVLGSDGRLQTAVYLGDSDSFEDYKETLTTSGNITVDPWPFDDIPAAAPTTPATAFAPPLFAWTQTTATTVNLTAADAGKAYEADSTAGNITFNLPSAASVGNGKGFAFKKSVGANSVIIDPNSSELLDGSSSQYFMGNFMQTKVIISNGAAWFTVDEYLYNDIYKTIDTLTEDTTPDRTADFVSTYDVSASSGKKVKLSNLLSTAGTAQVTTSGTAFDFTSLPAGIKRITVMFSSVSLSGTDSILVQIGDSGGVSASGYESQGGVNTGSGVGTLGSTAGFVIFIGTAIRVFTGQMFITRLTGNQWVASFNGGDLAATGNTFQGGGSKSLSNELDRLRITRTGSNTFDLGSVNILYE